MRYYVSLLLSVFTTASFSQQSTYTSLSSSVRLNSVSNYSLPINPIVMRTQPLPSYLSEGGYLPYEVYDAMSSRFNSKKNWTLNKKEFRITIGATQFLGDLGGRDQIGTDYRLKDLDWPSTGFGVGLGYRYRFHNLFATTTSVSFGLLRGADSLVVKDGADSDSTGGQFRLARNLSFRAPVLDINQRIEMMVYLKEKVGKRYNIKGLKGFKNRNEQAYIFVGIGLLAFMPQAKYDDKWYRLRPLRTEGQGLIGSQTTKYSPVTVIIPMGFGFRVGISREWRIGMEASYTKTFSDYIDDVHGIYYDKNLLAAQKGDIAAALSNRTPLNSDGSVNNGYEAGAQRGQPERDSYYNINIVLTRNITYRNYTKTYKHFKLQKSKYKF